MKRSLFFVLLGLNVFCPAVWAQRATTPVPVARVTGPIPVTGASFPMGAWNRNQEVVDLPKLGYVEEEYFVSGSANVYDWAPDGAITVKIANAPYTTRILVKKPTNPARFSGNVIVELVDSGRGIDRPFLWAISHDYFIEHGDAFVGITHDPAAADGIRKFNPTRYAPLSFANPNPSERCGAENATSETEEGLQWDIVSQVGALLKSNSANSPLAGLRVQYLYATSHSGDVSTYTNAIHARANLENGRPVYDGYLIKANGDPIAIRRCAVAPTKGDPRQITTRNVSVPVIRVIPQGDVLTTSTARRADSDEQGDRFRLYEVAGAPHMDPSYYRHLPILEDQRAAGAPAFLWQWPLAYACTPPISLMEFPVMQYALNAAFANLDRWVRTNEPPPRADRISIKDLGTSQASFMTDRHGNVLGGVRSPYLDVPRATYIPNSPGPQICRQLGQKRDFGWSEMERLYGSFAGYAGRVNKSVDELIRQRWLTASDGKKIRAELLGP